MPAPWDFFGLALAATVATLAVVRLARLRQSARAALAALAIVLAVGYFYVEGSGRREAREIDAEPTERAEHAWSPANCPPPPPGEIIVGPLQEPVESCVHPPELFELQIREFEREEHVLGSPVEIDDQCGIPVDHHEVGIQVRPLQAQHFRNLRLAEAVPAAAHHGVEAVGERQGPPVGVDGHQGLAQGRPVGARPGQQQVVGLHAQPARLDIGLLGLNHPAATSLGVAQKKSRDAPHQGAIWRQEF